MEYRRCQPPCSRFIANDDPHSKCVKCMGFSHMREAVYGISKCKFCENFRLKTLHTRLAKPSQILHTQALRESTTWGSDVELEAMESEQTGFASSLPLSPEHVRVRKLPFFSDLHHEISRFWKQPFSSRLTNAAAADFTNLKFRSAKSQSAALRQFMPRRARDHSNTPSSSLSRERSLPRKETASRSSALVHPPPTTVWGARGRPLPHRRPRRRIDLKRPDRPAASAPSSRS
ncbi:hypothetical protein G5714_017781 [Onychostoma macrolepis]|uniref:Uncharacterized protein n=1 Tax=Onychostoma macrolepis TaxID=369639 RepID=A0A7J6C243_9TELE|nr:hypothetical protein G5714_017781 [Onychostoma macrolepis]